jgi:chemotaxis protein histidine kinase CheA
VSEQPLPPNPEKPESKPPTGSLRSPIRPAQPDQPPSQTQPQQPNTVQAEEDAAEKPPTATSPKNPINALEVLRKKMEHIASEFADGKINRAQFNAIYRRYDEQRTIIERLTERNPGSDAWKQVARPGHTSFLRTHFEAHCIYYLVYNLTAPTPLMIGGEQQPDMTKIEPVLQTLYGLEKRPPNGLARKEIDSSHWLVLALTQHAFTIAMFNLEPSMTQINRVRDLHNDFERANRIALERGTSRLERMVFPQRALVES